MSKKLKINIHFGKRYHQLRITSADMPTKCPFLVFFGTTDGNFIEKYSVRPS